MSTNRAEYMREYRRKNAAAINANNRRYRAAHPDKTKDWAQRSLHRSHAPTRPNPGKCEACGSSEPGRRLCVDHDHDSNVFRGWLCRPCNLALGNLGDSVERIGQLLRYMENARCQF